MNSILVSYHPSRRRLEILFPYKPDARVRYRMKEVGFQWDGLASTPGRRDGVWHLARPVSLKFVRNEPVQVNGWKLAVDLATEIAGLTASHIEGLNRLRAELGETSGADYSDLAYEDRCAEICGL